jgi:hypothetical protein
MDQNRTILVNLNLYSEKFQIYKCTEEKIIICVNVSYLNKLTRALNACQPKDKAEIVIILKFSKRYWLFSKLNDIFMKIKFTFKLNNISVQT